MLCTYAVNFLAVVIELVAAWPGQQPYQTTLRELKAPSPAVTVPPCPFASGKLERRQDSGENTLPSTCGYSNGVFQSSRVAASGWVCTTDIQNGLWGFCPSSIYVASSCGLAGNCVCAVDSQGYLFTDIAGGWLPMYLGLWTVWVSIQHLHLVRSYVPAERQVPKRSLFPFIAPLECPIYQYSRLTLPQWQLSVLHRRLPDTRGSANVYVSRVWP